MHIEYMHKLLLVIVYKYSPNSFRTSWVSIHNEANIADLEKYKLSVQAQKTIRSNKNKKQEMTYNRKYLITTKRGYWVNK